MALGRLGETKRVIDVDADATLVAKILRDHFDTSLQTLLERHDWGFATKFSSLALFASDPMDTWAYAYTIPSDCLRIRQLAAEGEFMDTFLYPDELIQFKEVYDATGTKIYANLEDAWAEYTYNVPSSYSFPNHFGRALAAQLAIDIAPQVVTNNFSKVKNIMEADAESAIELGISFDISKKPRPETSDSKFIRVRI